MKIRIPIWIKLFLMTVLILLAAMIPTAYTNYSRIKTESVDREWQIVSYQAESRAEEINLTLGNLIEKSKFIAAQLLNLQLKNEKLTEKDLSAFSSDPHLLNIELIKLVDTKTELILRQSQIKSFTEFRLPETFYNNLREKTKFPVQKVFLGQIIVENATGFSPPGTDANFGLFTIGIPFSKDSQGQIEMILLVDIHLAALQKPFLQKSESLSYLADQTGLLLAHPESDLVFHKKNMLQEPLIQHATQNLKNNQFQKKFKDPLDQQEKIGVYARTAYGPIVVFQTALSEVLAPAEAVKREFIKNLAYAFFASLVLISVFSLTLTKPIEKLADLIKLVTKGQFDLHAKKIVNSNDEVGDLAIAFDEMTLGLKERDKVKNLFSKFHGSSVAKDLMNSELVLGGQSKSVVVFFSDIRGFTAYSENRSAQEIVDMLNEYFAIMVDIINRNGGVVDKFIGDAIMAVWGAPESSEDDAVKAVQACLQMRMALAELNELRISRNEAAIQIGMGLHAGDAISGTIGSSERMEYTVIGNTVNTASRVEASTKSFGADLLITEQVLEKLKDSFMVYPAGSAEVKGRSEPIRMFKVGGYISATGDQIEVKTPYSEYLAEDSDKIKKVS